MIVFRFTQADGHMICSEMLTSGMVGKEVKLEFSPEWDEYTKTAVFTAGFESRTVVGVSEMVTIPHEVLENPGHTLYVGVYGVAPDGRVIPTIQAQGPHIHRGVDPSGDPSAEPTLPIWAQLQQQIEELKQNGSDGDNSGNSGGGITVTDDGEGNVAITSYGSVNILDDGMGNITIA